MAGLLAFFYRTIWGVLLPMLVVATAILWTMGILQVLGFSLNALTVLLPTILLVVGVSDSVHFLTHYFRHLEGGLTKKESLRNTRKEIGRTLLLTSVTTAFGFLSLLVAPLPALKQFGTFTALGVMLAFGWTILLLPVLLSWLSIKTFQSGISTQERVAELLRKVLLHTEQFRPWYGTLLVIFILFGGIGLTKAGHDRFILDDLA